MVAAEESCVTPQEYLERERKADTKSEYIAGEIVAMAGATDEHNALSVNTTLALGNQLRGKACRLYVADMRVQVTEAGAYLYPDLMVVCQEPEFTGTRKDTLLNPTVVIEILSPSTEGYDRGEKFHYYRQLDSLTDYLLVSQSLMRVEHYARQPNGLWLLSDTAGPDGVVEIPSIGCRLSLSDIYDRVEVRIPNTGRSVE